MMMKTYALTSVLFSLFLTNISLANSPRMAKSYHISTNNNTIDIDLTKGGEIFNNPKEMPEFPNGEKGLQLYFLKNNSINDRNLTGLVYVKFVIQKSGKVSNVKILNSNNNILNKEAERLVSEMPNWTPGINKDMDSVHTHMILPIQFKHVQYKNANIETLENEINQLKTNLPLTGKEDNTLRTTVEPQFPAGEFALSLFVSTHLETDNIKQNHKKIATAYVNCSISTNGEIINPKVIKGPNKSLSDEALRLVKLMPHWVPARKEGKAIAVEYDIPIRFNAILFTKN